MKRTLQKIKTSGIFFTALLAGSMSAQISYTFTSAGATGRFGPTTPQITAAYLSTNLNGLVTQVGGIQSWTVPVTGPYKIEASGASGGNMATTSYPFGTGATMIGDFTLTAGQVIKIVVGQKGLQTPNGIWEGCGGGGASFVVSSVGNTPLVVAAGGSGGDGSGNYSSRQKPGGSSATGNAATQGQALTPLASGAGGGFNLNGQNGNVSTGGTSFINGATGGQCLYGNLVSHGGFGGGGAGDYYSMGGAGGGYQGGNSLGGYSNTDGLSQAYSYNVGINQVNTSGTTTTNNALQIDGRVIITSLYGVSIAQTASIACNGLSTAALSASVNGGVGPFTYSWSPSGGTASTATALSAGVYTCLVTSSTSGTVANTFTVTQPSVIVPSISSQTNVTCFGGANAVVSLSVSGGSSPYTYTWTPTGGNAITASSLTAGSYTCQIGDANLCASSITVNITQPAAITGASTNSSVCNGGTVALNGSGATSYTWSGNVVNGVAFTPTAGASYTVVGSNTLTGCTGTAVVAVSLSAPPVISITNPTICTGQTTTLNPTGASTYSYSSGSAIVNPPSTAVFTISGTSAAGCLASPVTVTVEVSACTGINKNSFENVNVTIYPNPSNGIVNVALNTELTKNSILEVFDVLGKLVVKQALTGELNTINISNLNSGIYTFKVSNNSNTVKIAKIIKQ